MTKDGGASNLSPVSKLVDRQGVTAPPIQSGAKVILVPLVNELHVAQIHPQPERVLLVRGMHAPVLGCKRVVGRMLNGVVITCRATMKILTDDLVRYGSLQAVRLKQVAQRQLQARLFLQQ